MKIGKAPIGSSNGLRSTEKTSQLMKLLEEQLKDIYWAEKALIKVLPRMINNATSKELINTLISHLAETENQITRVEQVFKSIGKNATTKKCDAMEGLIQETDDIIESSDAGAMRDAGIILTSQKIEHYEIATYGTLYAFAKILGEDDATALFKLTLEEEKHADLKLSKLAQIINVQAAENQTK